MIDPKVGSGAAACDRRQGIGFRRRIAERPKDCYLPGMERLFGNPAYKRFVLQDVKRLPARFYAHISGTLLTQLG